MTIRDIISLTRKRLQDLNPPYLWDNEELIAYCNEAIRQMCLKTAVIQDESTEAVCNIALVPGVSTYPLDRRVIFIDHVDLFYDGEQYPNLERVNLSQIMTGNPSYFNSSGRPTAFCLDKETGKIMTYPTTDTTGMMRLNVYREPLLALAVMEDIPEVDSSYHFLLVAGICMFATNKVDSDTYDPAANAKHTAEWMANLEQLQRIRAKTTTIPNVVMNYEGYL